MNRQKLNMYSRNYFYLFLILLVTLGNAYTANAQSISTRYSDYKENGTEDALKINRLVSQINPTVYLSHNDTMKSYGETSPIVLQTDVASISMLYQEKEEFRNVELIKILLKSPTDKVAKIDQSKLISFESLKYLMFVFEYNACSNNTDICIEAYANSLITRSPESGLKVLYELSIPQ